MIMALICISASAAAAETTVPDYQSLTDTEALAKGLSPFKVTNSDGNIYQCWAPKELLPSKSRNLSSEILITCNELSEQNDRVLLSRCGKCSVYKKIR